MKQSNQINIRPDDRTLRVFEEINRVTGIKNQDVIRALLTGLCNHWERYKSLSLPIEFSQGFGLPTAEKTKKSTTNKISDKGTQSTHKKGVGRGRMKELRESGLNKPFNPAESAEQEAADRLGLSGSQQRFSTPPAERAKANKKRGGRTTKSVRKTPHNTKPTKLKP